MCACVPQSDNHTSPKFILEVSHVISTGNVYFEILLSGTEFDALPINEQPKYNYSK